MGGPAAKAGAWRRFTALVGAMLGGNPREVAIGSLDPGTDRGLGIEPLEERIAPGTLIVNPPGHGHGTEVELPDAADHGRERAIERSPALENPLPVEPPIGGF